MKKILCVLGTSTLTMIAQANQISEVIFETPINATTVKAKFNTPINISGYCLVKVESPSMLSVEGIAKSINNSQNLEQQEIEILLTEDMWEHPKNITLQCPTDSGLVSKQFYRQGPPKINVNIYSNQLESDNYRISGGLFVDGQTANTNCSEYAKGSSIFQDEFDSLQIFHASYIPVSGEIKLQNNYAQTKFECTSESGTTVVLVEFNKDNSNLTITSKVIGYQTNISTLPPHPGETGKLTLEGIDADNDGVRDDVQIEIFNRYPNDEKKRAALRQLAKKYQHSILASNSNDDNELYDILRESSDAISCLVDVFQEDSFDELAFMKFHAKNTDERFLAVLKFDSKFDGEVINSSINKEPCE